MAWRVAKSLDVLLEEINKAAPHRSKLSDGSIGNAEHAARTSDHNPYIRDGNVGIVTARDYTHDPAGGFDAYKAASVLLAHRDPRIKYVISNRKIFYGVYKDHAPWAWQAYHGKNPHDHHTHVSVLSDKPHYDSISIWDLAGEFDGAQTMTSPPASAPVMALPLLKRGDKSEAVRTAQRLLYLAGYTVGTVDGDFGDKTRQGVMAFQKAHGLSADGAIGASTWTALNVPSSSTSPDKAAEQDTFFVAPYPGMDAFGLLWGRTFERFEANAYPDPTPTKAAQGYGHNASSGVPPLPVIGGPAWTKDYAERVYASDVAIQGRYLNYYVSVPLKQSHINALTLDIFKLGPAAWKKDKVHTLLNTGDYGAAGEAIRHRPTVLKGVSRRYGILADIFHGGTPDPKSW